MGSKFTSTLDRPRNSGQSKNGSVSKQRMPPDAGRPFKSAEARIDGLYRRMDKKEKELDDIKQEYSCLFAEMQQVKAAFKQIMPLLHNAGQNAIQIDTYIQYSFWFIREFNHTESFIEYLIKQNIAGGRYNA